MTPLLAAGGSRALWYATRGTGVVSLVLLTLVVVLGVVGSRRLRTDRWPRFLVVGLHRNLTLLTLAFLGVHIATTVVDSYAPVVLKDAVLPFTSAYRPVWLGFGAVAFDLLLALTITSLLRARIGYRPWRLLHWLAYASWPVALAHALGTGSDARIGWFQTLAVASTIAVAAAVVVRLLDPGVDGTRRVVAAAGTGLALILGVVWYGSGPGARGWASRAGTPSTLLAPAGARTAVRASAPAQPTAQPTAAQLPAPPYRAPVTGRLTTAIDRGTGLVLLNIRGRTTGAAKGVLWIRLQGEPLDGGGVSMTASGASFGPAGAPETYVGKIVALQGTRIDLALQNSAGGRLTLHVSLQIDQSAHRVSGTVVAAPGPGDSQ